MATSRPSLNPLQNPTLVAIEIRELEYAAMLLFYEAMHGVDFFGPNSDPAGTSALALGFVSHLAQQSPGTPDSVVENLAALGVKVQVTTADGNTSEVKTTKQYRDLKANDQPGPLGSKITTITLTIGGKTITYQTKSVYLLQPQQLS